MVTLSCFLKLWLKKKKVPSHTVGKSLRAQRDTLLPFLFFKVGKGSG